ncbi:MAG TPA: hypothetical protein VG389_23600, partial [Myxococcota bacterium]|nr:hypothetical protein [Myxococcota bacterium]
TDAPPWPTGVRAGWAARLDTAGATLAAADAAATAATDAHGAARGAYAQVVRSAWRALVLLKRELKYAGLTEVQVHEIIPDASRRAAAAASTAPDVTVATDLLEGGSTAPAGELPAQAETVPAMVSAREVDPAPDDAGPTEPVRDAADPLAERKASP